MRRIREEGDHTADHDLESMDLIDGEWVEIVIEVKATRGEDFRFPMSKDELSCAHRYGEQHRLYRVIDIASATPRVFVFNNPYDLRKDGHALAEPRDTYVTLPGPRRNHSAYE